MNCTERDEPNEASLLSEYFKMMNLRYRKSIKFSSIDVNDKKQFLDLLGDEWANVIHISAHGYSRKFKSGRRTLIYVKDESVTSKEIAELPNITRKLVSVSACLTSYKDMANAFINIGAKHYIAPKSEIDWVDAVVFFIIFYKRYLYDQISFHRSFNYARKHSSLSKDFPEYWYMK
ncbi:MAG: CHAT domain-containing protein [Promethearchaeota archaeon]